MIQRVSTVLQIIAQTIFSKTDECDILLLHHELLESQCEKKYNLTTSEAHVMATKEYDWSGKIEELFGEDGELDDLL